MDIRLVLVLACRLVLSMPQVESRVNNNTAASAATEIALAITGTFSVVEVRVSRSKIYQRTANIEVSIPSKQVAEVLHTRYMVGTALWTNSLRRDRIQSR